MCSICKDILIDFAVEHENEPFKCPIRNGRYCSYCAKYGHLTASCPAPPSRSMREPIYVEQLIPPSELKIYNITSRTPISTSYQKEEPQQLLEIKDNDKVIAAYLSARSIKVSKGGVKRHVLEEYAKQQNKRLVYIQ
jgi:hypothetical protein